MQNLETEKSKIDYSKMTISQLEASRDKLREDIKKNWKRKYNYVICFKVRTYGR